MNSTLIRKVVRVGRSIAVTMTDIIPKEWLYVKVRVIERGENKVVVEFERIM